MKKRMMKLIAERLGLTGEESKLIVKSFDVVGDIAIIKVPNELLNLRFKIGKELVRELKNVKAVFRQASKISGDYRLRKLEWLAGEKRTLTIYREHGCVYRVDVEKTYFSPRLSNERLRIAKLVCGGETVVNMFAGVGPYSILIAKMHPNVRVYSIDLNPYAVKLHVENCRLNKVEDRVEVIYGDAEDILRRRLSGSANRVLMPLPEKAIKYLDAALKGLKNRGILHVYLHVPYVERELEALNKACQLVTREVERLKAKVLEVKANRVREVKTRTLQICVDTCVKKLET